MNFLIAFICTFILCWISVPLFLIALSAINFYTVIMEGRCKVYMLFGRVLGVIPEPGLHFLWLRLGPEAVLVRFFGRVYEIESIQGNFHKSRGSGIEPQTEVRVKYTPDPENDFAIAAVDKAGNETLFKTHTSVLMGKAACGSATMMSATLLTASVS